MKNLKVNSIEEVKEMLDDAGKLSTLGVVAFYNEKTGKSEMIPVKNLVEKIGKDKAAEFLFDMITKNGDCISVSESEAKALIKKFRDNPTSLTEAETQLLTIMSSKVQSTPMYQIRTCLFDTITKILVEANKEGYFDDIQTLLIAFGNYLEATVLVSSDVSKLSNSNMPLVLKTVSEIADKIALPEDVNDSLLLLALLHVINNKFMKQGILKDKINIKALINVLSLDKDMIYDSEEECEECHSKCEDDCCKCNQEPESGSLEEAINSFVNKEKDSDTTQSHEDNIIDIRSRLRKRD